MLLWLIIIPVALLIPCIWMRRRWWTQHAGRVDQANDPGQRGFEVRPRKPMIQSLEDRIAP